MVAIARDIEMKEEASPPASNHDAHDDVRHQEHEALAVQLLQSWHQSKLPPHEWYSQASAITRRQLHLFLLSGRSLGIFSANDVRKREERYNLPVDWWRDESLWVKDDASTAAPPPAPTMTTSSAGAADDGAGVFSRTVTNDVEERKQQRKVTWAKKRSVARLRHRRVSNAGEQSLIVDEQNKPPRPSHSKSDVNQELPREKACFQPGKYLEWLQGWVSLLASRVSLS